MKGWIIASLTAMVLIGACARVPPESVELSATLGRDLAEVHRAHRELVVRYFDRSRRDVNTFVNEVYRPYTVRNAVEDFRLVERINNPQIDTLVLLNVFVEEVTREIEGFREKLLEPIHRREQIVLRRIDDSYQQLQNANAIVTGHLASVRRVKEAQSEVLDRTRLQGLQQTMTADVAGFSDRIARWVEIGREADVTSDTALQMIDNLRGLAEELDR